MRKIRFIAPVESMQGNLSGGQDLEYAENDNKAYQAPNGTQYAKNYTTRYIGNRRTSDGAVYFAVKQRTATVLNAQSRKNMALLSVGAAWYSALTLDAVSMATITANYKFAKANAGSDAPKYLKSLRTYIDHYTRPVLQYFRASVTFSGNGGNVTLANPMYLNATASTRLINQDTWDKFADMLAFCIAGNTLVRNYCTFSIDGTQYFVATQDADTVITWADTNLSYLTNPNYTASRPPITTQENNILFNGLQLYTQEGAAVTSATLIAQGGNYTTNPPIA